MANIKVSEMTEATSFDDGDYTMIVQANQNKKIVKENLLGNIEANIGDLSQLETSDKTNLVNAVNEIKNSKNYLVQTFSNASCTQNSSNNLAGVNLTTGVWVVVGNFKYSGSDLRYYFNISSYGETSSYDNNGIVAGNVSAIINVTAETTNIVLSLWPTNKNITVSGSLKAIKYQ